ncbi:E3 ubiquitin-protein ligase RNF8 [Orchesella cincta]|uniref:E3 ubiquitin-protein ligase RNF8 n=1 Tax=Orchesella cincta TaxID=48709 RepID=A0A1D2NM50_ORCCI|nr:E3 ubiquitin-protein ligase RNF8 [Orchesella cincta]
MSYPNSLPASLEFYRNGGSQRTCTDNVRQSAGWISDNNNNAEDNNNNPLGNQSHSSPRLIDYNSISQGLTPRRYGSGSGETRRRLPPYRIQTQQLSVAPEPPSTNHRQINDDGPPPHYDEALNFVSSSKQIWEHLRQKQKSELCTEFVKEHFTCPICRDTIIDSTAISCGHKYCLACIDECLRTKPVCPLCDKLITSKTMQYADDLAIDSISQNLSVEWKIRRQQSAIYSRMNAVKLTWYTMFCNWLWITQHRTMISARRFGRACSNSIRRSCESITLTGCVKLMLVVAAVAITLLNLNEITTFCLYLYYAMQNYESGRPANLQLSEIITKYFDSKNVAQQPKSRFQDFVGPSDTIYADIIRLFYTDWTFWE